MDSDKLSDIESNDVLPDAAETSGGNADGATVSDGEGQHKGLRERTSERAHQQTTVHGHAMERAAIFKFAGLIAFVIIVAVVMVLLWPSIKDIFTEGGPARLVERLQNAGPAGVFILLGMQFLQIVVAFIPGEVVQLAAGLMYGPWLGSLIILIGCVISSAIVYQLVHKLGAPFVQSMVSTEHMQRFMKFEESGKLDVIVFILFLIPAMPKDVFTYIVPLTEMELKRFLLITNVGRIPGILVSTYAAHGFGNGNIVGPAVALGIIAVIAILAVVFRERLMDFLEKRGW